MSNIWTKCWNGVANFDYEIMLISVRSSRSGEISAAHRERLTPFSVTFISFEPTPYKVTESIFTLILKLFCAFIPRARLCSSLKVLQMIIKIKQKHCICFNGQTKFRLLWSSLSSWWLSLLWRQFKVIDNVTENETISNISSNVLHITIVRLFFNSCAKRE